MGEITKHIKEYVIICDNIWTNYDDLTAKSLDLGPKK